MLKQQIEEIKKNTLFGNQVFLKSFNKADITETYIGWLNDPETTRFSNQRHTHHDRNACVEYLASFNDTLNLFLSVHLIENNEAIGTMTAYVSEAHRTADIGILIGKRTVLGKGLGRDAWNTLQSWLLKKTMIRKVTAGALRANVPMLRVMKSTGMVHEATKRKQELLNNQPQDILYFAKFH